MSTTRFGSVMGINVVPYCAKEDPTNNPSNPYSPHNYDKMLDNLKDIKETLVLEIQPDEGGFSSIERILDLGITESWFYALNCLTVSLYDPSVLFSSISVECILNHDIRLEKLRQSQSYEWIDLNWKNLAGAFYEGLPVKLLMNSDDKFERYGIEFVERRNKVAHGDLEGYRKNYPGHFDVHYGDNFDVGHSRPSKEHALDQLEKAKKFIIEWARQKPKVRLH